MTQITLFGPPIREIVVLSYGAGQDSTALLYRLINDGAFYNRYVGDRELLVVFSDTGNEFPETYAQVERAARICAEHQIEYHVLWEGSEFHTAAWRSLLDYFENTANTRDRGVTITTRSMGFRYKACTGNLKIRPIYKWLNHWISKRFGFDPYHKGALYRYANNFGRIPVMIGFDASETTRVEKSAQIEFRIPYFSTITRVYPLIETCWTRGDCQRYIRALDEPVPFPSNCMLCHWSSPIDLIYLFKFHRAMYDRWVELEQQKLINFADKGSKNDTMFGTVGGKKVTIDEMLQIALDRHGHMSEVSLIEYKMTHGHDVRSSY